MTAPDGPPLRPAEILARLWGTLAAPLATEIGAVAALLGTAAVAMAVGLGAVVVLGLLMPFVRPPEGLVRIAILVAGPPLRYAAVLVAVGKTWLAPQEGMVPALLVLVDLAFLIPLVGFLVAQARAGSGWATPRNR
jgi:hypothetical protein